MNPLNSEQVPAWLEQIEQVESRQSDNSRPNNSRASNKVRSAPPSGEHYELEQQTFAIAFESLLPFVADGATLTQFCRSYLDTYGEQLNLARFRAWIFRAEKRRQAYYGAKALGADAMEEELVRLSDGLDPDGNPTLADVARSTLQINTRKWIMQVNNRERYGDVKRVDTTVTKKFDPNNVSKEQLQLKLLEAFGINPDELEGEGELFEHDPD